jgi:flagella basal body P-ring formation protein FlgA
VKSILLIFFSCLFTYPVLAYSVVSDETKQVIIEKAQESIESKYDTGEYRFTLSARWIPGSLLQTHSSNIKSVKLEGGVQRYTNFEVLYQEGSRLEQVQIQLKVDTEQMLPVLNRRMVQGEIIEAEDFDIRWVPVDMGREKLIDDEKLLPGKTLRRTVNAGSPVEYSIISSPYLVEAGDEVEMEFTEFGIQIVLTCESRKSGAINDEIQIYCKETRKKYLGKITGPGEAQWQKTY